MPKHRQAYRQDPQPQDSDAEEAAADTGQPYETLEDSWHGLIGAGRAALGSELAYQKARALLAGSLGVKVLLWGLLALALLFFVLMALVVGSLIGLAAWLGPWAALGIVCAVLLVATFVSLLTVLSKLRSIKRIFAGDDA